MYIPKIFVFPLFIPLFLSSCKKDDKNISPNQSPPIVESISDYFLSDSSNYWIYETIQIDTNNNQRFIKKDTVTVRTENVKETEYIVYEINTKVNPNSKVDYYVKDSAGYRNSRNIIFSATDLNTILNIDSTHPDIYITKYKMTKDSIDLIVPVGTFNNVLTYQGEVRTLDNYSKIRYTKQSYVKGVGLAFESYFYLFSNIRIERRLIDYQVK